MGGHVTVDGDVMVDGWDVTIDGWGRRGQVWRIWEERLACGSDNARPPPAAPAQRCAIACAAGAFSFAGMFIAITLCAQAPCELHSNFRMTFSIAISL